MAEMVDYTHASKFLPERRFWAFLKQGELFQLKILFAYDQHSVLIDLKNIGCKRSLLQLALTNLNTV